MYAQPTHNKTLLQGFTHIYSKLELTHSFENYVARRRAGTMFYPAYASAVVMMSLELKFSVPCIVHGTAYH